MADNNSQKHGYGKLLALQKGIFEQHIFDSYFNLRTGIALLAFLLPLVLLIWGYAVEGHLRDSMSNYYIDVNGKSMRDWFVGTLWAIAVFLILYKGWQRQEGGWLNENRALNYAGLCAIGVAMFPMQSKSVSIHGTCAVLLFLLMAYVCICLARDTLDELKDEKQKHWYLKAYRILGVLMILVPIIALGIAYIFSSLKQYTFFVEWVGVWVFASYWLVKSSEMSLTGMERSVSDISLASLAVNETRVVENIDPAVRNYPTGILVEEGAQYEIEPDGKWIDWFWPCGPEGWGNWFPLKYLNRKHGKPFFLLCGSIGKSDAEELSFCFDEGKPWHVPDRLEDNEDHQLYLFANDVPFAYGNNRKCTSEPLKVAITRRR
ncbi:MAG: hypothetical protein P8103_14715 [Candidatus Thiodiazotropha sp.]